MEHPIITRRKDDSIGIQIKSLSTMKKKEKGKLKSEAAKMEKSNKNKKKKRPSWMTNKKSDITKSKEMNGKTYWWCE